MLECSQRYVEVFLEIYSVLFQSVVRDTFELSRRYIGLQSLICQSTCNKRYSQIYVTFQPDIQSEIHVRWSVFIQMLKCSQRYVRVQSEIQCKVVRVILVVVRNMLVVVKDMLQCSQRCVFVQSEICCSVVRVVRDILECSQRYVGVKSEKCWSVTPEMVCCWQLENVVGSQRYVGGKQRYVGVQSEIFWNVGMSPKNMAFFFSSSRIVYTCMLVFIQMVYRDILPQIFWYFWYFFCLWKHIGLHIQVGLLCQRKSQPIKANTRKQKQPQIFT